MEKITENKYILEKVSWNSITAHSCGETKEMLRYNVTVLHGHFMSNGQGVEIRHKHSWRLMFFPQSGVEGLNDARMLYCVSGRNFLCHFFSTGNSRT